MAQMSADPTGKGTKTDSIVPGVGRSAFLRIRGPRGFFCAICVLCGSWLLPLFAPFAVSGFQPCGL
jgi:hypothetical protein